MALFCKWHVCWSWIRESGICYYWSESRLQPTDQVGFFTGDTHINLAYITPFQAHGNITRLRGTAVLDTEIPVVQTYICKFQLYLHCYSLRIYFRYTNNGIQHGNHRTKRDAESSQLRSNRRTKSPFPPTWLRPDPELLLTRKSSRVD